MKALSIRQPWADAVIYGGKRIENRQAWKSCAYRGPILIHAAKSCTAAEHADALDFMRARNVGWLPYRRWNEQDARMAIIGGGDIVGVILPHGATAERPWGLGEHPLAGDPWYMGGFALVLANVYRFERPVRAKGMLGLFNAGMPTGAEGGRIIAC